MLGRIAIAKTGPGFIQDVGKIITYCTAATYQIERPDGTRFSWRVELCQYVVEDCPDCQGCGFVLPYPKGDFNHDLTPVVCLRCADY